MANVELNNHYYSNYKVVLTAEIVKDENAIDGTHQVDNIIYTLARINMEFVDGPAK